MPKLNAVLNHIEALDMLEDLATSVMAHTSDVRLLKLATDALNRIEEHDEALAVNDNAREAEWSAANDNSDDANALASAGFGTDEDYGHYGGDDEISDRL